MIAEADAADAVSESNEGNNIRSFFIRVGPALAVSALPVPAVASAGGPPAAGAPAKPGQEAARAGRDASMPDPACLAERFLAGGG